MMFSSRLQLLRQDPRSFLQPREKVNSNLDALDTVGFGAQSPDDSKPNRPHSPMDTELDVMTASGESVSDQITYLDAIRAALWDAIEDDDRVFLLGEDIGHFGGAF